MAYGSTNFSFSIIKNIGVIGEGVKGWNKEINLVEWNGRLPKYDIRDWSPDHEKMGKGITLTKDEAQSLYELLGRELKKG